MSIILQKYKNKRRLGKGAYGDVLLVEDPEGREFAIKMISKKVLRKDPYLEQYLEGQKQCMMSVKSPYIMELVGVEQDDNNIYFICEFCDGGDLLNYQAKQEKKVFSIKQTTKILSQVILGLELLHKMGYLHRDIKPQNILLKKTKNDIYQFKLADFGFAKKTEDVGGTVLGTQNYMSPEIYSNDVYSFEVDMWAFGVLMYFMLNMQFPFRINPHLPIQQKRQQLIKQTQVFSYAQVVKKSKKRIMENCIPQVEDLFKRMFNPKSQERITFAEIRQHPLFKQYFPTIDHQSKILYGNKKAGNRYDSFIQLKKSMIQPKNNMKPIQQPQVQQQMQAQNNTGQIQNITPSYCMKRIKSTTQKEIVELGIEKIKFLYQSGEELVLNLPFLDPAQLMAFRYNVLKYYVVLIRQYNNELRPEVYEKRFPNLKWKQFFKSPQFNKIKKEIKSSLDEAEMKVSQSYDSCRNSLVAIRNYNPKLQYILQPEVSETSFQGNFKQSYRCSTTGLYSKVRQKLSAGNRYVYLTLLVILTHSFNQVVDADQSQLIQIFKDFVNQSAKNESKMIDFCELRSWLSRSDKPKLKNVMIQIINRYFK